MSVVKVPGLFNFPGGGLYDRLDCGVAARTVCFFADLCSVFVSPEV